MASEASNIWAMRERELSSDTLVSRLRLEIEEMEDSPNLKCHPNPNPNPNPNPIAPPPLHHTNTIDSAVTVPGPYFARSLLVRGAPVAQLSRL